MKNPEKYTNIMFIVDGFRLGGAENKLLELIRLLDSSQFRKVVVNIGVDGPLKDAFYSLDCPVYTLKRKKIPVRMMFELVGLIRKYKIDVIQTVLIIADILGIAAAKLCNVKWITSWETVSHEKNYYHNSFFYQFGYRFVMKYANVIVSVSDYVKQSIVTCRNVPSQKIKTIHYGVNLDRFYVMSDKERKSLRKKHDISEDAFVIGIVARLTPEKGHAFFLSAAEKVVKSKKNIQILLIGDGREKEKLMKQIQTAGIENHVRFLGNRNDVPELLNTLNLFCLTTVVTEGFPNVVLEAMACGIPAIATDVGGPAEMIENGLNGFLVSPRDVDQLAEKLMLCVESSSLMKTMQKNARKICEEKFSLNNQIFSFERLFLSET